MKNYEKPVINETKIQVEGVYAGSGEEEIGKGGSIGKCKSGNNWFYKGDSGNCKKCPMNQNGACLEGFSAKL